MPPGTTIIASTGRSTLDELRRGLRRAIRRHEGRHAAIWRGIFLKILARLECTGALAIAVTDTRITRFLPSSFSALRWSDSDAPPERKLSCSQLRQIALRRRGHPDVYALLWEIKRLHGVLVRAYELTSPIYKALPDLTSRETVLRRLTDLLEAEPAIDNPTPSPYGKQRRQLPTENEEQRRVRFDEITEREAKRQARDKRG